MAKTFTTVTITDTTASKASQVQFARSALPLSEEVQELAARIAAEPDSSELWMQKGLALSKQMLFREAIEAYSMGLARNPFHALLYRHRGHRYISVRCFEQAAADLEMATRLDPKNWDSWYHLGLAYYLLGEYENAAKVYESCLNASRDDADRVAVIDWYWMTCKRLGREERADQLLEMVREDTDPGENASYLRRILMYKGLIRPEELMDIEGAPFPELELVTQGYGLANYYHLNGDEEKCDALLRQILGAKQFWAAFGYLAALVDAKSKGYDFEDIAAL